MAESTASQCSGNQNCQFFFFSRKVVHYSESVMNRCCLNKRASIWIDSWLKPKYSFTPRAKSILKRYQTSRKWTGWGHLPHFFRVHDTRGAQNHDTLKNKPASYISAHILDKPHLHTAFPEFANSAQLQTTVQWCNSFSKGVVRKISNIIQFGSIHFYVLIRILIFISSQLFCSRGCSSWSSVVQILRSQLWSGQKIHFKHLFFKVVSDPLPRSLTCSHVK